MRDKQTCTFCVMNNETDPIITFDKNGQCNYCKEAIKRMPYTYFPNEEGKKKLRNIITKIKQEGKGKEFDCIMGISGGLDSAYLAYLGAEKWGLRILAIHCNDGFDEPVAISNINKLVKKARIKLINISPPAEEFADLTKAYMRAGVPNIAIPQDNVISACLYEYALKYRIKYFLSGVNFSLEGVLQKGNTYTNRDSKNIYAIHKRFGERPINHLPIISPVKKDFIRFICGIKTIAPLNLIDYNKNHAIEELKDYCGFEYYGAKHLENRLTKFIQLYWIYQKFHIDKRTSHLSSLIVSGQLSRKDALKELENPIYNQSEMDNDIKFILDKLGMQREEFDKIMLDQNHQHNEYPTSKYLKIRDWISQNIFGRK